MDVFEDQLSRLVECQQQLDQWLDRRHGTLGETDFLHATVPSDIREMLLLVLLFLLWFLHGPVLVELDLFPLKHLLSDCYLFEGFVAVEAT